MKHTLYTCLLAVLAGLFIMSCSDDETYAEQKERERDVISAFLARDIKIMSSDGELVADVGRINVISENQFYAQGSQTYTEQNQYVLFGGTGVYMQIVREGAGKKLESGETKQVICRYVEFNIMYDSIQSRSDVMYWDTRPDIMDVTNTYGTFTASFNTKINKGGAMYSYYGSTSVPAGWLVPFSYIKIGRQVKEEEGIAKVRLIVPHTQGQADASSRVYPCFYELTYQEMK